MSAQTYKKTTIKYYIIQVALKELRVQKCTVDKKINVDFKMSCLFYVFPLLQVIYVNKIV